MLEMSRDDLDNAAIEGKIRVIFQVALLMLKHSMHVVDSAWGVVKRGWDGCPIPV